MTAYITKLKVSVSILLLSLYTINPASAQSTWNQLGADVDGSMGDRQGTSVSLSADGLTMATGAASGPNATLKGIVRIYTWDGSSWNQKGTDINGEADGDSFGAAISLSDDGNMIAIGAFSKDLTSNFAPNGRVQVYEWNDTMSSWEQKGSNIDGVADFENLGEAVSLSGDGKRLAVGIPGKDANGATAGGETGAVQVWRFDENLMTPDSDWTLLGTEIAGVEDLSAFGSAVSLDQTGTALAVGATVYTGGGASSIGQVRVYRYNGSAWEAKGTTKSTFDGTGNKALGTSVSLSSDGNRLAIGAPTDLFEVSNIGSVQVWDYASENWTQVGSDITSDLDGDAFGQRIELAGDGTHVVIGAANNITGNEAGRTEIYTFNSTWEQVGNDIIGEATDDGSGGAVAISNDGGLIASGASGNDGGGAEAGHVRVFEFGVANTPPVITASQSFSINENAANATSVGTVTATDANAGTTFSSWTITAGNEDGVFAIDGSTGEITVVDNTTLDFETTSSYTLTLTVSDGTDTSAPEMVTIDVTDIDEVAPSVTISSSVSNSTNVTPIPIIITFSEPVDQSDQASEFVEGDIVVGNGVVVSGSLSTSDNTVFTATITPSSDGSVTVDIAAGVARDAAGNDNEAATSFSVVSDQTKPVLLILEDVSFMELSMVNGPFDVAFVFEETVENFTATDVDVTGGALSDFLETSQGGFPYYKATITPTSGTTDVIITVVENGAEDPASNGNVETSVTVTFDEESPSPTITSTEGNPTNATSIPITIDFNEKVNDFTEEDITVDNGAIGTLTANGDNSVYTTSISGYQEGSINLTIAENAATDDAGNNSAAGSFAIAHDATRPVATITTDSETTNNSLIIVIIEFQEVVKDFTRDSLDITAATVGSFESADDQSFSLVLNPDPVGVDSTQIVVTLGVGKVKDLAGNTNEEEKSLSIIYDTKAPVASLHTQSSFIAGETSSTGFHDGSPFTGVLLLNENSADLTEVDLTISGGVVSNLAEFFGPRVLTFTVTPNGTENITVNIAANTYTDIAGNENVASNELLVTYDGTPPTITSMISEEGEATNKDQFEIIITFSEQVTGFLLEDLTVTNGNGLTLTTEDNQVYTATIGAQEEGEVTVMVKENSVEDLAGNELSGTESVSLIYDSSAPNVEIQDAPAAVNNTTPFTVMLKFSEENVVFASDDVFVDNGSTASPQSTGADTYTVEVTPDGEGDITLTVKDYTDNASNVGVQSQVIIRYDVTAPTVTITSTESSPTSKSQIPITVTFSEKIASGVPSLTVSNGTTTSLETTDNTVYTATMTATSEGTITVDLAANQVMDAAGNGNAAAQFSITYDPPYSGGDGTEGMPYLISNMDDLNDLRNNPEDFDKHFMQTNDITWSGDQPIGNASTAFTGTYDGNKFTISDFKLSSQQNLSKVALFVNVDSGIIKNLNLNAGTVDGLETEILAGFVAELNGSGRIENCHFSGNITARIDDVDALVAGIVGRIIDDAEVINCSMKGAFIIIDTEMSGFVDFLPGIVGGIAGENKGSIAQCQNFGEVGVSFVAGGIAGNSESGSIMDCYNYGIVEGSYSGGIVGVTNGNEQVSNSYNAGKISGWSAGGIAGGVGGGNIGIINNCYNIGFVEAKSFRETLNPKAGSLIGRVVGISEAQISNSFWDVETTGRDATQVVGEGNVTLSGSAGLSSLQMRNATAYIDAGWNFSDIWSYKLYYPLLKWQADNLEPFTVSGNVKDENGGAFSAGSIKPGFGTAVPLASDGSFSLDLPAGLTALSIIPDDNNAYNITYDGNTANFFVSKFVFHDQSGIEIQMIPKSSENLLTGNGSASGNVVGSNSGGSRMVQGRILEGEPLENVTISLIRTSDDQTMTTVLTDENGQFEITGIPEGEYQLLLAVAGIDLNLEGSTFTMDEEGTPLEISAAVSEDGISFTIEEVLGVADEIVVTVYPNPVREFLHVRVDGQAIIRVLDLSGSVIYQEDFTNETKVDVRQLMEGIHLIEVVNSQGRSVRKLVKNN